MTGPFTAEPVEGGVRVEMTRWFAWVFGRALRRLSLSYRHGNPLYALQRPFRMGRHASLLQGLYPEVAPSPKESKDFLRRHRDVLADRALLERVRARWQGRRPILLTHAEVDEWIAALGQVRLLFEARSAPKTAIMWTSLAQETLVLAVAPDTFTEPHHQRETTT
ncbi:hypothetical protein [Lentzea sp. NPDC003310]|uniref:DUF2017 family protein n=1 Tax=Lentzea sp. NPDC003310 TaxID=3154447 RepID=UPI0033A41896